MVNDFLKIVFNSVYLSISTLKTFQQQTMLFQSLKYVELSDSTSFKLQNAKHQTSPLRFTQPSFIGTIAKHAEYKAQGRQTHQKHGGNADIDFK